MDPTSGLNIWSIGKKKKNPWQKNPNNFTYWWYRYHQERWRHNLGSVSMPSALVCLSRLLLFSYLGMYVQTAACSLNISLEREYSNCSLPVWEANVAPCASAPACWVNAAPRNLVTSYLFPHSTFFSTTSHNKMFCHCCPNPATTTDPVWHIICTHTLGVFTKIAHFITDDH